MSKRLLPGDSAPGLKLAQVFNRNDVGPVVFDRTSVVVLWNAGCVGCLPAVSELAAFCEPRSVPVYGVAVLVRDVDATAAAAREGSNAAVLALEARPEAAAGLSRGAVTREWLEASGRDGVPSTYVIDAAGRLAWIGDPENAAPVVEAVLNGTWDIPAARAEWRAAISDDAMARKLALHEVTDALVAGRIADAAAHISAAERNAPAIADDAQFACLKLDVLARSAQREPEAAAHYAAAAIRFRDDAATQIQLASTALNTMPTNARVAEVARASLHATVAREDWSSKPLDMQLAATVLLSDAEVRLVRLGQLGDAEATLAAVAQLATSPALSERTRRWADRELTRLRAP